jgi:hypothetical protein
VEQSQHIRCGPDAYNIWNLRAALQITASNTILDEYCNTIAREISTTEHHIDWSSHETIASLAIVLLSIIG